MGILNKISDFVKNGRYAYFRYCYDNAGVYRVGKLNSKPIRQNCAMRPRCYGNEHLKQRLLGPTKSAIPTSDRPSIRHGALLPHKVLGNFPHQPFYLPHQPFGNCYCPKSAFPLSAVIIIITVFALNSSKTRVIRQKKANRTDKADKYCSNS